MVRPLVCTNVFEESTMIHSASSSPDPTHINKGGKAVPASNITPFTRKRQQGDPVLLLHDGIIDGNRLDGLEVVGFRRISVSR